MNPDDPSGRGGVPPTRRRGAAIGVGASAGGIEPLRAFVAALPADLPVPVLVVLHLSPTVPSRLPEILNAAGPLPARAAADKERLLPGRVYVAPSDYHLTVWHGFVRLSVGPKRHGVRPAVDALFETMADYYGPGAVGVVLSGMQSDGTLGLAEVRRHQGAVLVQDPEDALFPQMPQSALRALEADVVGFAETLAKAAVGFVNDWRRDDLARATASAAATRRPVRPEEALTKDLGANHPGELTPLRCPHCSGPLWEIETGCVVGYQCRVGHTYSMESLETSQAESLEGVLWSAIVALEDRRDLLERVEARLNSDLARDRMAAKVAQARRDADRIREVISEVVTKLGANGWTDDAGEAS